MFGSGGFFFFFFLEYWPAGWLVVLNNKSRGPSS